MVPRRRRPFTLAEWLIVLAIAGALFATSAPSRPRPGRHHRRITPAPPAAVQEPVIPVEIPDADKRVASPPSALRLWQRVQNPLALMLALHVIGRALRRSRRKRSNDPAPPEHAPLP